MVRYLNDVEHRMDGCHDPVKILMGRKAYKDGGPVETQDLTQIRKNHASGGAEDGLLGREGRGRMSPVDRNPRMIKDAMLSTAPKSAKSTMSQERGDFPSGPEYKKGGHTKRMHKKIGGSTCDSAMNSQKGMAEKMGLAEGGHAVPKDGVYAKGPMRRVRRAAGGVGKMRHEQYD